MRREIIKAESTNLLNHVILQGFEKLAAENALLCAENEGLKETVQL